MLPNRQQDSHHPDAMGDSCRVTHDIEADSLASTTTSADAGRYVGDPAVQAEWDSRYLDRDQL